MREKEKGRKKKRKVNRETRSDKWSRGYDTDRCIRDPRAKLLTPASIPLARLERLFGPLQKEQGSE